MHYTFYVLKLNRFDFASIKLVFHFSTFSNDCLAIKKENNINFNTSSSNLFKSSYQFKTTECRLQIKFKITLQLPDYNLQKQMRSPARQVAPLQLLNLRLMKKQLCKPTFYQSLSRAVLWLLHRRSSLCVRKVISIRQKRLKSEWPALICVANLHVALIAILEQLALIWKLKSKLTFSLIYLFLNTN